MSRIVGLAILLFLAVPGTAVAERPEVVWSGTMDESHVWSSSDSVVDGYPCQGSVEWGVRTEWAIDGSSARPASPRDPGNPGIASSYLVGPPDVDGVDAAGNITCESAIDPCIGVMVVPGDVSTEVSGTQWSPRLTYDPATGRLAIDSPASPNPQGSVTGSVDYSVSYPPNTACSSRHGTATVSGVGFPNRVNQGPPGEDYRLPAELGSDGKLHVHFPSGAPLEVSGESPGPGDGFSFSAFDDGGFIHAGSGSSYERLDTSLSADLVGECSDEAANLCGELTSLQAKRAARRALVARYRNRHANGRDKRIDCRETSSGTFKCRVSWWFATRRTSTAYAGSVTVSGDPSSPETALDIRTRRSAN